MRFHGPKWHFRDTFKGYVVTIRDIDCYRNFVGAFMNVFRNTPVGTAKGTSWHCLHGSMDSRGTEVL